MSAREKLVQTLVNSMAVTRLGRLDGIRREAEGLIDDFAHELSEEIRESNFEAPEGFTLRVEWRDAWNAGRDDSADLIDPEVET